MRLIVIFIIDFHMVFDLVQTKVYLKSKKQCNFNWVAGYSSLKFILKFLLDFVSKRISKLCCPSENKWMLYCNRLNSSLYDAYKKTDTSTLTKCADNAIYWNNSVEMIHCKWHHLNSAQLNCLAPIVLVLIQLRFPSKQTIRWVCANPILSAAKKQRCV